MKFQNPSFKIVLNGCTHFRTHARTDKPKQISSPLFQSGGTLNVSKLAAFEENIHECTNLWSFEFLKLMVLRLENETF